MEFAVSGPYMYFSDELCILQFIFKILKSSGPQETLSKRETWWGSGYYKMQAGIKKEVPSRK